MLHLPRPHAALPWTAVVLLVCAFGCDDEPDIRPDGTPPPDARRLDAEMDAGTADEPPSWHAHIRPLVEARCARCHAADSVSGYDLSETEWRDDAPPVWAGAVVATVLEGSMPPILPDPTCRSVQHAQPLTEDEIELFAEWRAGGYLEGDPVDYIPAAPVVLPNPGPATLRVDGGDAYIPSFSGARDRRCLPLGLDLPADAWLSGFAVVPDEPRMVRRASLYVVGPTHVDALDALDAAAPGAGYPCAEGPGLDGYRPLGIWLPGEPSFQLPGDHAFPLSAGSRLVLAVQYSARALEGAVPPERTAVDLWLPEDAPANRVEAVELLHTSLRLPADRQLTQGRNFNLGVEGTMIGAWARMGPRGVALDMSLMRDDGARCVLDLPRFDRDWVGGWLFDPIRWVPVSGGDVLELRCTHDNRDPAGSPVRTWGSAPEDERCDGVLLIARAADVVGGRPQCGGFAPCAEGCPPAADGGPDPDCFARCHGVGELLCPPCLLQATGACARESCGAELATLGACSAECDGADLGCIIERCLDPFGALARCIDTPIASGDCDGPYSACGVRFGP